MVSKRGGDGVSSPVLVRRSPGHDEDVGCPQIGHCRWGDYSGATPDPKAPVDRSAGVVWLTNMWTADADTTGGDTGCPGARGTGLPRRSALALRRERHGTGSSGGATERLGDLGSPDDPDTVFMP
jgi:hypothetical protein